MGTERLFLVQDNEIISNDFDIATIFNNYFYNITSKLAIQNWDKLGTSEDPILNAIYIYIYNCICEKEKKSQCY